MGRRPSGGGKTVKTYEFSTRRDGILGLGAGVRLLGPHRRRRQRGDDLQHPRRLHPRRGRDAFGQISARRRRRLHQREPRSPGARLVGQRERDLHRRLRRLQRHRAATARRRLLRLRPLRPQPRRPSFPGFNETLWLRLRRRHAAGLRRGRLAGRVRGAVCRRPRGSSRSSAWRGSTSTPTPSPRRPAPAALVGGSQSYGYGITTLGLRSQTALLTTAPLTLNGMIGWQHVYGGAAPTSALAFASQPFTPFSVAGAPIARNALALELGVDWRLTANCEARRLLLRPAVVGGERQRDQGEAGGEFLNARSACREEGISNGRAWARPSHSAC